MVAKVALNLMKDQGQRFEGQICRKNRAEGASGHSLEVKEEKELGTDRTKRQALIKQHPEQESQAEKVMCILLQRA